jgi:hypothetical protein
MAERTVFNGRRTVQQPLTETSASDQHASRFLLWCEALDSTREEPAVIGFERLFRGVVCRSPFAPPLRWLARTDLSVPRSRGSRHRLWPPLPTSQPDQHLHCAGWQKLGIKEVDDGIWLVSFMPYDLGYFDLEQKTLQPLDNPFGTRLSPMS